MPGRAIAQQCGTIAKILTLDNRHQPPTVSTRQLPRPGQVMNAAKRSCPQTVPDKEVSVVGQLLRPPPQATTQGHRLICDLQQPERMAPVQGTGLSSVACPLLYP